MAKQQLTTKKSFIYSIFFHVIFILIITASISFAPTPKPQQTLAYKQADKIVQAVSVNQTQVEQEIQKIKTEKLVQQQREQARVAKLQQEAKAAEQAKKSQQMQLAKVKKEQVEAQKKAQAQLSQLNAQKSETKQQLATLKKQTLTTAEQQQKLQKDIEKLKKAQASAEKQAQISDLQAQVAQEQTQLNAQKKQAKIQGEIQKYTTLMLQSIEHNWNYPENVNRALYCVLEIKLAQDGRVTQVKLVKSSGNQMLDQSAIAAVYKSSPLPVSTDPDVFKKMQDINLKASPQGQIS
ncbi:MAG: protein TolA [Legionellales bacterium]|nr:protein TolA [Legionellales bacterium]|tara:strand:- start:538 stop:1419 length:882 start_codon:yes stop_codon:yes gene_type:complete